MSTSVLNEKLELNLNIYLELRNPKTKDVLERADNVREISVFVDNADYSQDKILTIVNFGNHVKVIEYYKSPLGEVNIERMLNNMKPSMVLRMLLPDTFK